MEKRSQFSHKKLSPTSNKKNEPTNIALPVHPYLYYKEQLEFCILRSTRERYHVAYVLHACNEEDKTLETESETSVRT